MYIVVYRFILCFHKRSCCRVYRQDSHYICIVERVFFMLSGRMKPLKINYRQELFILFVVNILCFFIFSSYDTLEWLYHFSRSHEDLELDEFIPLCFSLTVTFALFSYRRWKEAQLFYIEIEYLSFHDSLTGLLNRRGAQLKMAHMPQIYTEAAVVFIDFDNFKQLNQLYGYEVGDEILKQVGNALMRHYNHAVLARWAGEELLIIAPCISRQMLPSFADEVYRCITKSVALSAYSVSVSMGVVWGDAQSDSQHLLMLVDEALLQAKRRGGAQVNVFDH